MRAREHIITLEFIAERMALGRICGCTALPEEVEWYLILRGYLRYLWIRLGSERVNAFRE